MYIHSGLKFKQNIETDLHFVIKEIWHDVVTVQCLKGTSEWEENWEYDVVKNAFAIEEYVPILNDVEKEAYRRYPIIEEALWKAETFDTYEEYCLSQYNDRCNFIVGANFGINLITGENEV